MDGKERSIRGQKVLDRIEDLGKPVIAAVNGFALGGGCELAMACHVRIASDNARLGTPEVKLGIMCGYAGTQRLPRLVGKGRALEMLLTGEMVDAQEALRIGLVNRVVPKDKLMAEAEALLRKMLANGPVSLRFTIEAVNSGLELPLAEAQYLEATLFGLICTTDDMKEGTKAFLEKRPAEVHRASDERDRTPATVARRRRRRPPLAEGLRGRLARCDVRLQRRGSWTACSPGRARRSRDMGVAARTSPPSTSRARSSCRWPPRRRPLRPLRRRGRPGRGDPRRDRPLRAHRPRSGGGAGRGGAGDAGSRWASAC